MKPNLKVRMVCNDPDLMPIYATPGAAGMDLCCAQDAYIFPDQVTVIPTGISLEIPDGYEAQVRPRSGLAAREAVTVLNSPGTIDSDYRGEVKVIVFKHGPKSLILKKGERIAQIVFAPVAKAELIVVKSLDETERGDNGFGSTGTRRLPRRTTT